jgi:hypothetical protein
MTKLTALQRRALLVIESEPKLWPKDFGKLMWPDWNQGLEGQQHRNRVGAPTLNWYAAGYLGRLRAAGLITGGEYALERTSGFKRTYTRSPLRLTAKARELLLQPQSS